MILPSIEDESRYTAPPEPKEERWEEPEDDIDWLEKNFPDENTEASDRPQNHTPQGDFGKMHET